MMKKILYLAIAAIVTVGCGDKNNDTPIPNVTPDATGTYTDPRDDNAYDWVSYGGLDWMSENLRYVNTVGNTTAYELAASFEGEENEVERLVPEYGYLYDFDAARTACPEGWRLPTDEDWQRLERTLGMRDSELNSRGFRGDYQGYLMQSGSGLEMKPGGFYSKYTVAFTNHFRFFGVYGYFWTSTADGEGYYLFRKIAYSSDQVCRESTMESNRLSIRCVRDSQ